MTSSSAITALPWTRISEIVSGLDGDDGVAGV